MLGERAPAFGWAASEATGEAWIAGGAQPVAEVLERYALLIELSPESIIVHQRGTIVYANAATCRLLGVPDTACVVGALISAYVHPEDVAPMLERIAGLDVTGAVSSATELRIVRPDGRLRDVSSVSVRTTWQGSAAYQVVIRDLQSERCAEAALRYQAALVAHVSDAIVATDNDGTVTSWNPAAELMYGWAAIDAVGRNVIDVIGVDPPLGEGVDAVHDRHDGTAIDVRLSVAELRDERDVVTGRVLVCSDITESKAAEQRHAAVVESLQEGVVVLRADRSVESMNPVAERLLGIGVAEILRGDMADMRVVTDVGTPFEPADRPITAVRETGVARENVTLGLQRGGTTTWLSCGFRPLHTRRGAPYPIVITFRDITESRLAEAALQYQASHDSLTGLASRPFIVESIRAFLHGDKAADAMLTVIFLDLDRFKVVNDSLGHGVGDRMLRVIGGRLQDIVTAGDVVGRIGGDGFLVVARGPRSVDEASALAEELRATIGEPLTIAGRTLTIAASAGVVVVHGSSAHTAEAILRDADVAMYQAKDAGRGRQQIFDSALRERALRRLQLEEDLRTALDSDELFVAYQPLIDLATGRAKATEALLRWNHADFGPVSPVEFIRIAEETGLIVRLGARVLELACVQTAIWRSQYPDLANLQVAVNVSARQLSDPMLLSTVRHVLLRARLPADALWLELTESMLMDDPDGAIRVLQGLRDLGVHISIDDFGTGYSSLSYLRQFPVEELKIDRSFVVAMTSNADDAAIVASVTALAHTLGLTVVAEGIETPAQLESVRQLGIDVGQGYLFSRPALAVDVLAALRHPPRL